MKVKVLNLFGMHPDMTIENINYVTGEILLDHAWNAPTPIGVIPVTFYGDRNLNFSPDRFITGLNVIDNMIFWTDNHSEPKKINIERSKKGSLSHNMAGYAELNGRIDNFSHNSNGLQISVDDFNMHTLLVLEQNPQKDCLKDEIFCPPAGCTDPTADNYDPAAVLDDGTCGYFGCLDPAALNTGEDCFGNVISGTVIPDNKCCCYRGGCTDPNACNYDDQACFDDGSCVGSAGCTDPTANNFDPLASCDDGTCNYNYSCVPAGTYSTNSCPDPADEIMVNANNYNYTFTNGPNTSGSWSEEYGGETTTRLNTQGSLNYQWFNTWDPGIKDGIFPNIPNQAAMIDNAGTTLNHTDLVNNGFGTDLILSGSPIRLGRITTSTGNPAATKDGNAPITDVNIMIPVFKDWFPNAKFIDKWFWKWDIGNVLAWDPNVNPTNGICDYPLGTSGGGSATGLKQKTKIEKVTISGMWGKPNGVTPDNMTMAAWQVIDKPGTAEIWDAGANTWVPDPGMPMSGFTGAPGDAGSYYCNQGPQYRYVDSNGEIFGVGDFHSYTAQFGDCGGGVPCPDGESWNDITAYLRANGFDGATGPRIPEAGYVSTDGTTTYGMIRPDRMGYVANMGGVINANIGPGCGTFAWEYINNTNFKSDGISWQPQTPGMTGYPEITGTENYDEWLAKITNNYKGWEFVTGGDVITPPQVRWKEKACDCSNMATTSSCVQDPLGPYANFNACNCCGSCDCHNPVCNTL